MHLVFSQCCEVGGFWGSAEEGWGVCCREKEEGLSVLEKAVYAVGQKDGVLGGSCKHSPLVIPGVGKSTCSCSNTYGRCHGQT